MVYLIDLKKFFENVFLLKRAWLKQQEFTQHGERSGKKILGIVKKSFFSQANDSFLKGP